MGKNLTKKEIKQRCWKKKYDAAPEVECANCHMLEHNRMY
jgi:hypothetical protein